MKDFLEIPLLFEGFPGWYKCLGLAWFIGLCVLVGARFFIEPKKKDKEASTAQTAKQQMENSPGAFQIGNLNGTLTYNQLNAGKPETISRLKSEVLRLLRYPNAINDTSEPPTMLEGMLSNHLPRRLFVVLMSYDENDVVGIPKVGIQLQQFMYSYYQFREKIIGLERELFPRIGQNVEGRLAPAWQLYMKYMILRFSGNSKEQIIAGPNFLNFSITWEDAERVYRVFINDVEVTRKFAEIFSENKELGDKVEALKLLVQAEWRANQT